jgi:hypothetical protein
MDSVGSDGGRAEFRENFIWCHDPAAIKVIVAELCWIPQRMQEKSGNCVPYVFPTKQ